MLLSEFLTALITAAEKGSKIAQIVRAENTLLELLIEEKEGKEKNDRFVQDFKTLADVLIQEMVRHDLSVKFPGLESSFYGEESNCFTNTAGKSVVVQLCSTVDETANLLKEVLDGNEEAASILSQALHENSSTSINIPKGEEEVSIEDVGVWIDPIDSTAQYIRGHCGSEDSDGIIDEGLQCVTVLIGAFDKHTGQSIAGVCVQPFSSLDTNTNKWSSSTTWGVCYKDVKLSSIPPTMYLPKHSIIISSSEADTIKQKLSTKFRLHSAAGAGYKILCATLGNVDAYVLSKATIFKWDCCAPHAILRSIGGGITSYRRLEEIQDGRHCDQLQYQFSSVEGSSCFPGIIAYRSEEVLSEIVQCLRTLT